MFLTKTPKRYKAALSISEPNFFLPNRQNGPNFVQAADSGCQGIKGGTKLSTVYNQIKSCPIGEVLKDIVTSVDQNTTKTSI